MPIQVDLIEFLRTGNCGPLHLGMMREELLALLGVPDAYHQGRKEHLPTIYKYGDFEFYFPVRGDDLLLIFLDNFNVPAGNGNLIISPSWLQGSMGLREVEEKLTGEEIGFEQNWGPVPTQIQLKTVGGVILTFEWHSGDGELFVISYSQNAER